METNTQFANDLAVWLFGFLTLLYFGQMAWAWRQGREEITEQRRKDTPLRYHLADCLRTYDDGIRNIWVFAILAIFLPVFLNSISDLTVLVNDKTNKRDVASFVPSLEQLQRSLDATRMQADRSRRESEIIFRREAIRILGEDVVREAEIGTKLRALLDRLSSTGQRSYERVASDMDNAAAATSRVIDELQNISPREASIPGPKYIYYLCLSFVTILITLEFSYLHSLRRSAPDWIPMLLSALVLDLIALLVLVFVVGNPTDWSYPHPQFLTRVAFGIATIVAVVSSVYILMLARTAGALHDGQIDTSLLAELKKNQTATADAG